MQRRTARLAAAAALTTISVLGLTACGGSGFSDTSDGAGASGELTSSDDALSVLIAASGDAEATAVTDAVAAWSSESGTGAEVSVASDLPQQLSQGFASGEPADVFYLSTDALAGFAGNGSLLAYGDRLSNADDFYPALVDSFTVDDQFYCAPKDFSTLGLIINDDMWAEAGLTDADVPTDWDGLREVAAELTTADHVGLAFSPEYARVGAFMAQAGGTVTNAEGTEATLDSDENVEALTYVQELLASGDAAYSSDLGAGWGGEAFGTGAAAMTIEGNWIAGAMSADYPDVSYRVDELPAGPGGQGTLQFTNCWGIAADSPNQEAAVALVEQLTGTDQQLAFADAFGVMPSIESAAEEWKSANPDEAAFLDSVEFAQGVPTQDGSAAVIADFNSQLAGLEDGDPTTILESAQQNFAAILD
ncbi:sugar ABC transporter substrate-binding protein [Frigoribacterium sp. Leaf164]|uniref:sugar ABC transporter substrate-binding protein n=1 Tax=Frigoribacterium sp. Leaf164 TaxID=1736282 RepID=UPI0006F497BE|nr:extracellular solute-binding protein [Frigoribacterium sp. Leaf164]KQR46021.1 sugar ABC transporter substrate-binding protein [Frigoribacterium sp. Leaf164]